MIRLPPFYEHSNIYLIDIAISAEVRREFRQVLQSDLDKHKLFTFDGTCIRTSSKVGIVTLGSFCVQVLPKLLEHEVSDNSYLMSNLMHMISVTGVNSDFSEQYPAVSSMELDFIDVIIFQFCSQLEKALRKQKLLQYVSQEENISRVKGKIDFSHDTRENLFNKARVYCRYDDLTSNNLILQTLKFAATAMHKFVNRAPTKILLNSCLRLMEDVDCKRYPQSTLNSITLTRHQSVYRSPWNLALLFLKMRSPNLLDGGRESISLVFDMNVLFERYVGYLFKTHKADLGLKTVDCKHSVKIYNESIGDQVSTEAFQGSQDGEIDFLLETESGEMLILDTKYKRPNRSKSEGKILLSQDDMYQIFTYTHIKSFKDGRPHCALIYPKDHHDFLINLNLKDKDLAWNAFTVDLHRDLISEEKAILDSLRVNLNFISNRSKSSD